ncbi:histidine--tRNA ligase [Candidatus Woesearchaeota archaeon]|nr:histidine--tRNA ligase [Candidatus Woesearchaeota archaeon]RLE40577.1 MAG: histidine--tRNA ligase [Candidatus Woesearchaeota archaeon]
MELQRAKGTRDFMPEEKILRNEIVSTLKAMFERYGFYPIETPILERFSTLSAKYAGGSEILKETFKLTDQGGRQLGLRYDLTVPLARFIAMNPTLKMPFKRYQIGRVFRDGPIKLGRYREFWQCDADIVGCKDLIADVEILQMALDAFNALDLDVIIKLNSRKLLDEIFSYTKVPQEKRIDAILSIDKLEKFGWDYVEKELTELGLKEETIKTLKDIFSIKGENKEIIENLKKILGSDLEGLKEVEEILSYFEDEKRILFTPSLARGLAYYTGPIYEVFLQKSEITSAVAAGGRYDEMIGRFASANAKREIPATGIAFGLDVIMDAMKEKRKELPKTKARVLIIPIGTKKESFKLAVQLRKVGINADLAIVERSIKKQLEYANALNIPYVIFYGEEELKKGKIKLKNMQTGEETELTKEDLINLLK